MFSSMITKNLNWETLTKNSVTFKRWDGVKDGVNIMGVRWFLGGGGGGAQKYKNIGRITLNGGRLGQFADLRGAWQKRWGGVFEGVWYPNAHSHIETSPLICRAH